MSVMTFKSIFGNPLKNKENVSNLMSSVFNVNPRPNPRVVLHESLTRPWIQVPEKGSPERIEEREEKEIDSERKNKGSLWLLHK